MTFEQIAGRLKQFRVGIAGCGGLGSNSAAALVRSGIGTLVIADFDEVTEGNLNRQFFFRDQVGCKKTGALRENLLRIDPALQIIAHDVTLTERNIPEIFAGCHVIVEAFDRADQKLMLLETVQEAMPEIPVVTGLGMAGWGRSDTVHMRRAGNIYICGDEVSEIRPDLPPLAPRVGMVASMQANVVLEILLGG